MALPAPVLDDAFHYTSGRWLYNESKRLAERHVSFDMHSLMRAAAASVNRSYEDINSVRKVAEGGFNRVFELTMKDGFQLIARIPYASAQPKHLATASEVATMALVRSHGVPVPQVYTYSADPGNAAGCDYIIMEKAHGRCLGDIWFEMSDKDRVRLLGDIADYEAKLSQICLPAFGSVYYEQDLPVAFKRIRIENQPLRCCIGPDVSLKNWFGSRESLDIPRGPAFTAAEIYTNVANRELAWLRAHGKPRMPFEREYREMFNYDRVDPEEHVKTLQNFVKVAAHLVPSEDWQLKPTLRHPDLNPNNIFVNDACSIVSIIDWQHVVALPLFLAAGIPGSLQNYGDPESEELRKPEFPQNLDQMDPDDQQKDLELYRRRHAHFYYIGATAVNFNTHYKALAADRGLFRKKLYHHAAAPWEGNSIPLKAALVQAVRSWQDITRQRSDSSQNCPISFSGAEAEDIMSKMVEQEHMDSNMSILRDILGISSDGWVSYERYKDAAAEAAAMKEQAMKCAEDEHEREMTDKHWPFQDFDEEE
ncbi:hypothetical protein CBER1_09945 [Cercospora berteroae]|uniref:Aminoglycoside phosphotransferase domain-containing protein n=1 Tax=Cercospora berteroae TaxID=357750 RepID=A0A2S6CDW1_9PEZI|nr:hypothetical protein CBER1_09945 [Cercospora berteroae]